MATGKPLVTGFYEERTSSIQYVVACPATKRCAIIDPVLDFDEKSGATATVSADALLAFVETKGLTLDWILDTHPHADHLSASAYLKAKTGAPTAIGAAITAVQKIWAEILDWPDLPCDGSQWDRLFAEGDSFAVGEIEGRILFSPGHTRASITYLIGDAAFIHDTMLMPDSGTARADFLGGSPEHLYDSIQAILALPDATRLFVGHDYRPNGREPRWETSVIEQKMTNIHLVAKPDLEGFVALRQARDNTLPQPRRILQALQVNIRAGRLPEPDAKGRRFLKFPLDALDAPVWSEESR